MEEIEKHIFEDINFFPNKMKILILGIFPVPLYSQKEKFNLLSKDKKENAWYYSSSRSEFWKLIADSFDIDNKEFLANKSLKKKLFADKNIGIADVFSKCKRKNKESSKDTDLIIIEYNNSIADIFKNYKSLKLIIFTSRFTENNFFKILNDSNLHYELKESEDIKTHYKNRNDITNEIINSVRERFILINDLKNLKVKIATITLKISPIKGVSLYSTKKELFKYYLNLY
ncbi:uracil-DNA glycosylase family protein [Brachyspira catarrhinii]|uniref:Uracil-DNA glycosylase family protein n=1 Tax=Brachyspira catarrhinii TaxID=2528966 RepID=A0ABY2TTC6_9SPIR|nr:uracil-DNA glycosylase family protein [Brachyspira catarrhinii]TKZ36127.1 uracil-DNA glycosylase family protein [Brachyspira catarrhinii]